MRDDLNKKVFVEDYKYIKIRKKDGKAKKVKVIYGFGDYLWTYLNKNIKTKKGD